MTSLRTLLLLCLCWLCRDGVGAERDSTTLRKIKASGVITIGYREGSVPFSYLDNHHQPVGFSMDICNKVVVAIRERSSAKLFSGLPFRLMMTSPDLIPALADPEFGSTSLTKAPR